jgi:hypothetical protein
MPQSFKLFIKMLGITGPVSVELFREVLKVQHARSFLGHRNLLSFK